MSTPPFAVLHDLGLVHTDLKPENILLVDSDFVSVPYRVGGHTLHRFGLFMSANCFLAADKGKPDGQAKTAAQELFNAPDRFWECNV